MQKKKIVLVLIAGMIMMSSLTACRKTEDETDNITNAANGVMEEVKDEQKIYIIEGETLQQKTDASLAFLTNSPEYLACSEWWDFCEGYDTDGAILEQVGNKPVEADYEYEAYNCYSPEMEKKVEEICEKYNLSKLSGFRFVDDYNELCSKAGVGDFCERVSDRVKQTVLSCYLYNDGTFLMEGTATLAGSSIYEVSYQFVRVAKGYFSSAYLDFGDFVECNVRAYTTKKGENVYFANIINEEWDTKTYIIVDREKSFIVINVLVDIADIIDVSDERLELLADAFNFAVIP